MRSLVVLGTSIGLSMSSLASASDVKPLPTAGIKGWSANRVDGPMNCQPESGVEPASIALSTKPVRHSSVEGEPFYTTVRHLDASEIATLDGFEVRGLAFSCEFEPDGFSGGMLPDSSTIYELLKDDTRAALFTHVVSFISSPSRTAFYLENYVKTAEGWEHRYRIINPGTKRLKLLPKTKCNTPVGWVGDRLLMVEEDFSDANEVCLFDESAKLTARWSMPLSVMMAGMEPVFASRLTVHGSVLVNLDPMDCRLDVLDLNTGSSFSRDLGESCDIAPLTSALESAPTTPTFAKVKALVSQ